ncbi:tyrosine-type recombinase/integrase [Endozoicomonas atrinae]|uniref:tyrosine-type recombinase/integrase n=1 Tax=Endozoicomonas atrinae TaxID=1333660 RepID=UPI000825B30A|nr:hypothetical protein [Endozoicomonas atrinae]
MDTITEVALAEAKAEVHGSNAKRELTEKLDGLPGVLMARVSDRKIDFFYKYQWEKKRELLLLGTYAARKQKERVTLPEAFELVLQEAEIRKEGKNPKEERRIKELKIEAGLKRRIKQAEIQGYGTFGRMLQIYLNTLTDTDTRKDIERMFKREIEKPFPQLLILPARDIEWEQIKPILNDILERGKGPSANKLLDYIKAAFNKVINIQLDSGVSLYADDEFGLIANPLQHIKSNKTFNSAGKDKWTRKELADIWFNAIEYCGPVAGRFIRFTIANAGQRIKQLVRVSWTDYHLESKIPYTEVTNMKKKRGGDEVSHLVPLNDLALKELLDLQQITGHCDFPFPSRKGAGFLTDKPMGHEVYTKHMKRICDGLDIRLLSLGETRTTIKTMLGPYKIPKHIKNLLHGHGKMDVADIYYDKFDYLEEKSEVMNLWNGVLEEILEEHKPVWVR